MSQLTEHRIATVGMFDGVHTGHAYLLRCLADMNPHRLKPLVVTFPNHPLSVVAPDKAPKLLTDAAEKEALLRNAGVDVAMLPFDSRLRRLTAAEFLAMLRRDYNVDTLLMGFDNHIGSDRIDNHEMMKQIAADAGISLTYGEAFNRHEAASTVIRRMIADEGDMRHAAHALGHPYSLSGHVVHGDAIGRTLGFPTANIHPDNPDKILPLRGVYAATAHLTPAINNTHAPCSPQALSDPKVLKVPNDLKASAQYPAVVNIGFRPTLGDASELRIEAFIDGFDGDLYGRRVTLTFNHRLRDERRFPDLPSLRAAIAADLASTRQLTRQLTRE